jgi:hypothetical protein
VNVESGLEGAVTLLDRADVLDLEALDPLIGEMAGLAACSPKIRTRWRASEPAKVVRYQTARVC